MSIEEQIRASVESIDVAPRGVGDVVTRARRRRRARAVVGVVVTTVLVALLVALPSLVDTSPSPDGSTTATTPPADADVVPADRRSDPVALAGRSATGARLDVADLRGSVVVVRFWGSWCAPCRDDVPVLTDLTGRPGVEGLGVRVRETSPPSTSSMDMPFGSIVVREKALTDALGSRAPRAVPTTWVLDRNGRLAAEVAGRLEPGQLDDTVTALLAEPEPPRELSAHDGRYCPPTLPLSSQESYGFGTGESAPVAPELTVPSTVWRCEYQPRDVAPRGSNGAWYEWTLSGTPTRLDVDRREALVVLTSRLAPPTEERACNADLGSRILFSFAHDDDLTGVVLDDFGCRDVRLTDDPFVTAPGDATQPGTVSGVLAVPQEDLVALLGQ